MDMEKYNFDDITPIPMDSSASDDIVLCKIMYSNEFIEIFSYLRALMKKNELSKRAKYVACLAIDKVPAHYTVWDYKFQIVEFLNNEDDFNLFDEIDWCSDIALNNPKNYQIWHYRQRLINLIIKSKYNSDESKYDLNLEYDIVNKMLFNDEKNYHVWSHKRWIVQTFRLFNNELELECLEKLIDSDVRNNSAWNHRHFVRFGLKNKDENIKDYEINHVKQYIEKSPTNPSSWNYWKSVLAESDLKRADIRNFVLKFTNIDNGQLSVPAFELLSEIHLADNEIDKCLQIYDFLATELDPIRVNYWRYKREKLL